MLGRAELFLFILLTNRSKGTAFNPQVGPDRRLCNTNIMYNVIFKKKAAWCLTKKSYILMEVFRDDNVFPL